MLLDKQLIWIRFFFKQVYSAVVGHVEGKLMSNLIFKTFDRATKISQIGKKPSEYLRVYGLREIVVAAAGKI